MSTTNSVNNTIGSIGTNNFLSQIRATPGQWVFYDDQTDIHGYYSGVGSPEGVVAADIGSLYSDTGAGATGAFYKSTDTVSTGWLNLLTPSTGISSVTAQRFTATGAFTYTPSLGMKFVIVELIGGGGGSGGTAATIAGQSAAVSGAGAGGYAKFILTAAQVGASLAGVVGAGGAGGAAGNNNGTAGSATTLATTAPWTVNGGGASTGSASAVAVVENAIPGGTVTSGTGTILVTNTGQAGSGAMGAGGATMAFNGFGGSGIYGAGGINNPIVGINTTAIASAAAGFGAGAGGPGSTGTSAALAGAAGANGIAIFTEFV